MTGLEFNQALREGRRVYGTLLTSTSPRWVPLIAGLPLDFVFIDTEHIPIDRAQLSWMTWAYRYAGLAPMVRIPSPDPFAACQVLDGGACSIVAPYVENAAQVRDLVGAVKHRPLKGVTLAAALAAPATLSFEDGVPGAAVGSGYNGFDVTTGSAQFFDPSGAARPGAAAR